MVEVICDTSFLIHLATKRIKNISSIENDVGSIQFVVPHIVIDELKKLCNDNTKKNEALASLNYCKNLKKITIPGKFVDAALVEYIKQKKGIIGTMDKKLKSEIKNSGGSIISFTNDRMVIEPSKI